MAKYTNGGFTLQESGEAASRAENDRQTVVVIGTGDFGKALASHMQKRGCKVIIGSRNPSKYKHQLPNIRIMETSEALAESDIVCLAIPVEGFGSLNPDLFANKIVIDVSNRKSAKSSSKISQAEELQLHLNKSKVVKAFNTISAYALSSGQFQGSKEVPICSDFSDALEVVSSLVRKLGFSSVEYGDLSNARSIEDIPMAFFSEWKSSVVLGSIFFVLVFLYIVLRSDFCSYFDEDEFNKELLMSIPTIEFGMSLGQTALFLLTSCYLPGVIASYLQIYRGTKYSQFPKWLDNWLKMRKEMGLLAMLIGCYHVLIGMIVESQYFTLTFWRSHLFVYSGVSGLLCMSILAVTSLPSVSATLTWKEFSFLHRHLGWWTVFFITFHIIFLKWDELIKNQFKCTFLPNENQILICYPLITMALKAPLMIPFVNSYVQKIRRGYERIPKTQTV